MIDIWNAGNLYDNIKIDIEYLHKNFQRCHTSSFKKMPLYPTLLLNYAGFWEKLIDSGVIRYWFDEFNDYWVNCLKCRPLRFHDFFYLYANYRKKFQSVEVKDYSNTDEFLTSWQNYANISMIFSAVYKYSLEPISHYPFKKYLKKADYILEYGCGIAPITQSIMRFENQPLKQFYIADIHSFSYHYAKYQLSKFKNVNFIDLNPYKKPRFNSNFDVVFLMTVIEHLPDPLNVVKNITENMNKNGILIFDYSKSNAQGLDTIEAVNQRRDILNYIDNNFDILSGKLDMDNSMGLTICKKKKSYEAKLN